MLFEVSHQSLRPLKLRGHRPHEIPDYNFISAFPTIIHLNLDDVVATKILDLITRDKGDTNSAICPVLDCLLDS